MKIDSDYLQFCHVHKKNCCLSGGRWDAGGFLCHLLLGQAGPSEVGHSNKSSHFSLRRVCPGGKEPCFFSKQTQHDCCLLEVMTVYASWDLKKEGFYSDFGLNMRTPCSRKGYLQQEELYLYYESSLQITCIWFNPLCWNKTKIHWSF